MNSEIQFFERVDTVRSYNLFWMCWKVLGINTEYNKHLCGFYDLLLNIFITIYYPLHLIIGLFMETTQADIFKNLSINIVCIVCTLKHYLLRYKVNQIMKAQGIFQQLDKRAKEADECDYFNRVTKVGAKRIVQLFFVAYTGANVAAVLAVLLGSERRLLYPAWFPFDWQASPLVYWLALCYQIVGISIQIVQNLANDIYGPMSLCILGGHVRLLSMRVAKIGNDVRKTQEENNLELIECIEDHKKLLRIFYKLQDTLFYAQLAQFISSGVIICIVLIYLLFYVDNVFAYIYYTVYFVAMLVEIFPCCYYGSMLQWEFDSLSYAIFQSNWLDQTRAYHKNLGIFTELSLREIKPMAGGIISIKLDAFFATCKMAYSLFAVIMRVK